MDLLIKTINYCLSELVHPIYLLACLDLQLVMSQLKYTNVTPVKIIEAQGSISSIARTKVKKGTDEP